MKTIDALLALSCIPSKEDLQGRIKALSKCFESISAAENGHLLSIYAGADTPWDSPELIGLPAARMWKPIIDDNGYPGAFFTDDLIRHQKIGGAIERAATLIGMDPSVLQTASTTDESFLGMTLQEKMIEQLSMINAPSRLCEIVWKDMTLGLPTKLIALISLESDNYLVFVGTASEDIETVVFLGEQPFESDFMPSDHTVSSTTESVGEVIEDGNTTIYASDTAYSYWRSSDNLGSPSLLRLTLLQLIIPGQVIDILEPYRPPNWKEITALPIVKQ